MTQNDRAHSRFYNMFQFLYFIFICLLLLYSISLIHCRGIHRCSVSTHSTVLFYFRITFCIYFLSYISNIRRFYIHCDCVYIYYQCLLYLLFYFYFGMFSGFLFACATDNCLFNNCIANKTESRYFYFLSQIFLHRIVHLIFDR